MGIDSSRDLFAMIPDQPFPARGLVTAIIHLFTLGVVRSSWPTQREHKHLLLCHSRLFCVLQLKFGRLRKASYTGSST